MGETSFTFESETRCLNSVLQCRTVGLHNAQPPIASPNLRLVLGIKLVQLELPGRGGEERRGGGGGGGEGGGGGGREEEGGERTCNRNGRFTYLNGVRVRLPPSHLPSGGFAGKSIRFSRLNTFREL